MQKILPGITRLPISFLFKSFSLYIMGWGKDENDTMLWDLKTQSTSDRSNLVSQICLAKSHVPKDGVEQRLDFANPLRKHHIISTT